MRHRRVGDGQEFVFCVDLFVHDLLRDINDLDHGLLDAIFHVLFLNNIIESRHLILFSSNNFEIHGLKLKGFLFYQLL